jgi:hypothetical protein
MASYYYTFQEDHLNYLKIQLHQSCFISFSYTDFSITSESLNGQFKIIQENHDQAKQINQRRLSRINIFYSLVNLRVILLSNHDPQFQYVSYDK